MARKMHPDESRPNDGRDDLSILHPDREVQVGERPLKEKEVQLRLRKLIVREYGFAESLEIRPLVGVIVDALYQAFQMSDNLSAEQVMDALAVHHQAMCMLMARSADVDVDWVRKLPPVEGEILAFAWWGVNKDFFVMRASRRIVLEEAEKAPDGETSTPRLPDMASGIQGSSGNTPSGN